MVGWRWAADPMKEERRELRAALVFIVPYVQLECRNAHLSPARWWVQVTHGTYKLQDFKRDMFHVIVYFYFDPTTRWPNPDRKV